MSDLTLEDVSIEVQTMKPESCILKKVEEVEKLYQKALEKGGTLHETDIECKKVLDEGLARLAVKGDYLKSTAELRTIDLQSKMLKDYKTVDIEEIRLVAKKEAVKMEEKIKFKLSELSAKQSDVMTKVMKTVEAKFGDVIKTMEEMQVNYENKEECLKDIIDADFSPDYEVSEAGEEKEECEDAQKFTDDTEASEKDEIRDVKEVRNEGGKSYVQEDLTIEKQIKQDCQVTSESSFDEEQTRKRIKERLLKEEKDNKYSSDEDSMREKIRVKLIKEKMDNKKRDEEQRTLEKRKKQEKEKREQLKIKEKEEEHRKLNAQVEKKKELEKEKKLRKKLKMQEIEKQERAKLGLDSKENNKSVKKEVNDDESEWKMDKKIRSIEKQGSSRKKRSHSRSSSPSRSSSSLSRSRRSPSRSRRSPRKRVREETRMSPSRIKRNRSPRELIPKVTFSDTKHK